MKMNFVIEIIKKEIQMKLTLTAISVVLIFLISGPAMAMGQPETGSLIERSIESSKERGFAAFHGDRTSEAQGVRGYWGAGEPGVFDIDNIIESSKERGMVTYETNDLTMETPEVRGYFGPEHNIQDTIESSTERGLL
jgi:hypothetical protein